MAFDFGDMFRTATEAGLYGEAVIYTSPDGAVSSLGNAAWLESAPELTREESEQSETRRERVLILADELASPERRATVRRVATGEDWTVESVRSRRGAAWELTVTRAASVEKLRGKYR